MNKIHNCKISVTKLFEFEAGHHLKDYKGKCENPHGHSYKLEVTVKGRPDERGLVIDFSDLKNIVKENVIDKFDHKYLNHLFDFNTSCENLIWIIWEEIKKHLPEGITLEKVVLWETSTSYVTLTREDAEENEG